MKHNLRPHIARGPWRLPAAFNDAACRRCATGSLSTVSRSTEARSS